MGVRSQVAQEMMVPKSPPVLGGRELSPQELEAIRSEIESLDVIENLTDEMRELIASQWPHLLAKLRPPRTN
jgi:hypothetical protein